jgi:hypothetical protein
MAIAGIKISTLRELNTVAPDDYFVVNDASQTTTKRISYANLFANAITNGTDSGDGLVLTELKIGNVVVDRIVDEADGVVSNNNDTSIPTVAAIKSYVDGELSDRRAKSNLKPYVGALETLANLDVYEYNIATSLSREIGVIADELQETIPYLVNGEKDDVYENGNPKYQTVSYSKMVPILVAAIQELQNEVKELKSQIERG